MRRIAAASLVALASLPASAAAATWDVKSEPTEFQMKVGAPGADVCVVFPAAQRGTGSACDGVDLRAYGVEAPNHSLAVVRFDTFSVTVSIAPAESGREGELTAAEQRARHALSKRAMEQTTPPGVESTTTALPAVRVHGLQVLRARSEHARDGVVDVQSSYVVVGSAGVTEVAFLYERGAESVAEPAVAAMVDTFSAPRARSVGARLGTALLSLLAGAPLVVLAAALARKKRDHRDD